MMQHPNPVDVRLYGVVDPQRAEGRALDWIARQAVEGGVTLIQYRDKFATTRGFIDNARAIKAALAGTGVPLLINDRVDVALAVEADGVHIGQEDMRPVDARRLLGPKAIIGWSLQTEAEVRALEGEPLDYACIGAVFPTTIKVNPQPKGLSELARLLGLARTIAPLLPIGAIAGINEDNAAGVLGAGVDGIAMISAIVSAPDPRHAAQRLRQIVDESLAARGAA